MTTPRTSTRDRFFARDFSRISSNEWYGTSSHDSRLRTDIRDEFIESESIENPDIKYGRVLHDIPYSEIEQEYLKLLGEAQTDSDDTLYETIARKLAEMYRHKEVRRRLAGDAIDEALSIHRAEYMNEELFGEVEQQDFDAVMNRIYTQAESVAEVLPEAQELLQLIGEPKETSPDDFDFELHPDTLELLRNDLYELIPGLEQALAEPETRKVDAMEAVSWTRKILEATGMDKDGWQAVLAEGKVASTSKKDRLIKIGNKRIFESTGDMNKTNVHEVIGHGYRSYMASKQADPEKRGMLPGTLDAEEGGATVLEQVISGVPRRAGQRYLQALGLGKGMDRDGSTQRSFRETYEILYRTHMVEQAASGEVPDKLKSQHKAYQECMRTRRGGAIDARDISYFQGAKKVNPWFNQIARLPAEKRRKNLAIFLSGQFDPTNKDHAELFGLESVE